MVANNIRIAFLGDVLDTYEKTGIYYYTKALLECLQKKKVNILLVTGNKNSDANNYENVFVADYYGINTPSTSQTINKFRYIFRNIKLAVALNNLVDIVYSPQCRLSDLFYLLTNKVPFITTLHDLNFRCQDASFLEKIRNIFRQGIVRLLANRPKNRLVVPTTFIKNQVVDYLNIPSNKIIVLSACVEAPPSILNLNKSVARQKVKNRLGTDNYILFLGRQPLVPNLIKVLTVLKSKFDFNIPVVLVGRAIDKEQTIKSAIENGLDNLIVLGSVSDYFKWVLLRGAKLLLFPIDYGGFGIPPVEAMSVGTPVVVPKNDLMLEVVGCGGLLAETNVYSLAESVYLCCKDDTVAHNLSVNSLIKAKSYTQEHVAKSFLDLINELPIETTQKTRI